MDQLQPASTVQSHHSDEAQHLEHPEHDVVVIGDTGDDADAANAAAAVSQPSWGYDAPSDESLVAGLMAEYAVGQQLQHNTSALPPNQPQVWPLPTHSAKRPALPPAEPPAAASASLDVSSLHPRQLNFSSLSAGAPASGLACSSECWLACSGC